MSQNKGNTVSLKEVIVRIGTQIVGGLLGYSIMQQYWNLNLTPIHVSRAYYTTTQGNCLSYLNVDNATGALIGQFQPFLNLSIFICITFRLVK